MIMLKIYGVPFSVHTRKPIVMCLEKQINFEIEPVIPFTPPAEWDSLSPTGKIPAIEDGEFALSDSAAICAYIERTHPEDPLYPKDTKEYARALSLEQYAGALFRDVIHGLLFEKYIKPLVLKQATNTDAMDKILLEPMPKMFGYLNSQLSGQYFVGNQFSIADLSVVSNLINYHYTGLEIDANRYPKLAAYFKKQITRPSLAKAIAGEKPFTDSMGLDRGFVCAAGLEAAA
jgi:glutathione S-transferase